MLCSDKVSCACLLSKMILVLLATFLSVMINTFVSGGNEERYIQTRDILGWKVEEGRTVFHIQATQHYNYSSHV